MMKFSATDWSFAEECQERPHFYTALVQIGFDAIELVADPNHRRAAREAGLKILNTAAPGMKNGLNHPENHARLIPAITDCIHAAGQEAIPHVIVFSGNRLGQPEEAALINCRRAFEQLIPEAERAGVTLVLEMLNHFDHPDYQADHAMFGFQLCEQLQSPSFQTLYDIYHMHRMGAEPLSDIVTHLDKIAHLHLAEAPGRGIPQADGQIPYQRIVPKIVEAGYEGYWGFEFHPVAGASLDELNRARAQFLTYAS